MSTEPESKGTPPSAFAWRPIPGPVPDSVPQPNFNALAARKHLWSEDKSEILERAVFDQSWVYLDPQGKILFYVMRIFKSGQKLDLPITWCQKGENGVKDWRMKAPCSPRPLYRLNHLDSDSKAPVLVVEGQKAAEGACKYLPEGWAVVSSFGGAMSAKSTDWSPLIGRRVLVWPDNDQAGAKFALDVVNCLTKLGATSVDVIPLPTSLPGKWDLADDLPDGLSLADIREMIQSHLPVSSSVHVQGAPAQVIPRSVVNIGDTYDQTTDTAVRSLIANRSIFRSEKGLVRISIPTLIEEQSHLGVPNPYTEGVQAEWLLGEMSHLIEFVKQGKEGLVSAHPTKLFAQIVLQQTDAPWPLLRGVVKTPVILPGGKVLSCAGYDLHSGIYLASNETWPDFNTNVDVSTAQAAWGRLRTWLQDFPFAKLGPDQGAEASEAAWLAFCLTLLCRPGFEGPAPFFVFDGNKAGIGKGKLVQLAALVVVGFMPSTMQVSEDLDKFTQEVYSTLRSGTRLCWLDDVNPQFGNRVWNMVMTADEVSARPFFTQDLRSVPNRAVWAITANDINLHRESMRRAIQIKLHSELDEPHSRSDFKMSAPLLEEARRHQKQLLLDLITIVRGYHTAGCPASDIPALGSFENWSRMVADCVYWITGVDFIPRPALSSIAEQKRDSAALFLEALKVIFSVGMSFRVDQILDVVVQNSYEVSPQIRSSLEQMFGKSFDSLNPWALGRGLQRILDTPYNGLVLQRDIQGKSSKYRLTECSQNSLSALSHGAIQDGSENRHPPLEVTDLWGDLDPEG